MTGSASQAMDVVFWLSEAFQRRGPERRYMSRAFSGPHQTIYIYIYSQASKIEILADVFSEVGWRIAIYIYIHKLKILTYHFQEVSEIQSISK